MEFVNREGVSGQLRHKIDSIIAVDGNFVELSGNNID